MCKAVAVLLLALLGRATASSILSQTHLGLTQEAGAGRPADAAADRRQPPAATDAGGGGSGAANEPPKYLPVVMWHGMGDSCCSPYSMGAVKAAIEAALPGVFVHSISTGGSEIGDVMGGYFGNVNEQVARVCDQLLGMEELRGGYVAVGFSQGGQFMRAMAQRCQHLGPQMHTLVTMGAQHQGVMAVPGCPEPVPGGGTPSLYCRAMQALIAGGAYRPWVQSHVVQAQYVKDPYHLDLYRQRSIFLADINGETPGAPPPRRYRDNLASLQRLVLFQFDDDDMVVPRESSHFGFFNGSALLALQDTPLYQQDWIGLRALDEAGRLRLEHCPGRHMHFSLQWFTENVLLPYLAVRAPAGPAVAGGGEAVAAGAAASVEEGTHAAAAAAGAGMGVARAGAGGQRGG